MSRQFGLTFPHVQSAEVIRIDSIEHPCQKTGEKRGTESKYRSRDDFFKGYSRLALLTGTIKKKTVSYPFVMICQEGWMELFGVRLPQMICFWPLVTGTICLTLVSIWWMILLADNLLSAAKHKGFKAWKSCFWNPYLKENGSRKCECIVYQKKRTSQHASWPCWIVGCAGPLGSWGFLPWAGKERPMLSISMSSDSVRFKTEATLRSTEINGL